MSWTQVRWAITGMAIGLLIAVAPSCTPKPCSPDNCTLGCCNDKGACVGGQDVAACGTAGVACSACTANQACAAGKCTGGMGGGAGGGSGGGGGGGVAIPDAGQPCAKDDDCAYYKNGTFCNQAIGQCVKGTGCNSSSDCSSLNPLNPCYQYGLQCRCVQETGSPIFSGVCRRRLAPCEECTDNSQCGSEFLFDPLGTCKALQGDPSGKKFCFQQKIGACPCGNIDDGFGYCKPQNNSCSTPCCTEDKMCPSGSVCNKGAGLCEPRCRWDFVKKELSAPGCPPGKTCWVDDANLNGNSLYYGAGRCRTPCGTDAECKKSSTNAFGGDRLKCAGEGLSGGGTSDKRCRANGECMDNQECPEQPPAAIPLGYCDRGSLACKADCRTGTDPVTGSGYKDCRAPFACASDGGNPDAGNSVNFCRLLTCVEQGGASIACTRGEYCCGEDKNNDGMADPCPPVSERGPDNCYTAPKPPFCTTCMSNDDCKTVQLPGYLTGGGACANGSKSPSCSPLPMICLQASMNTAVCAPSTFNDGTRDSFGVGRDVKGCPAGYSPSIIRPRLAMGSDYCNTSADCSQGNDGGTCAVEQAITLMDGGHPKTCQCTVGGALSCPNNDAGLSSECRFGISGQTVPCVQSVVCTGGSFLFKDAGAPNFGCGLTP